MLGGDLGAGGFVLDLHMQLSVSKGVLRVYAGHTAISKSTIFSANVLISLLKQNRYSPTSFAVNTKSPCRSFVPSRITLSVGPITM